MNLAKQMLEQHVEMLGRFKNPSTSLTFFHQWLLDNGEEFGPAIRIRGKPLRKIKQCYSNSMRALMYYSVDKSEWFYTEGVVVTDNLPIMIDHAWLSNRKGEVLDLTLRSQKSATYYGVPFKFDHAFTKTMKKGYYGLYSNGCMYNQDIVGKPVAKRNRAWPKQGET